MPLSVISGIGPPGPQGIQGIQGPAGATIFYYDTSNVDSVVGASSQLMYCFAPPITSPPPGSPTGLGGKIVQIFASGGFVTNTNIKKLWLRMGANPPIDVDMVFSDTNAPLDDLRFWRSDIRIYRSQSNPANLAISLDIEFMRVDGQYKRVWKLDTNSAVPISSTCIVSFAGKDVIANTDIVQDKLIGLLSG